MIIKVFFTLWLYVNYREFQLKNILNLANLNKEVIKKDLNITISREEIPVKKKTDFLGAIINK